jgi:hypothetical protein
LKIWRPGRSRFDGPMIFTVRGEVFNTHGPGFFNGIWRLLSASLRQLERPKEGFLSIRSPRERDLRREPSTIRMICWCCKRGLNSRPLPYQGSALPLSYCSIRSASEQRGASCHSTEGMARRAEPFLRPCAFPAGPSGKGAAEGSTGCLDERNRGPSDKERQVVYEIQNICYRFSNGRTGPPGASAGDEIDRPPRRVGSEPARGFFCLERL